MTFATPIAATINHLLARQPALQATLAAHKGKVACVAIGALTLRLQVAADGLLTAPSESANHPDTEANPNVTIRISPADVPQILANRARAFSYVSLEGDADFAKSISEIANNLHWVAQAEASSGASSLTDFHTPLSWAVYLAFDAGEFTFDPDFDPVEGHTRPQIADIVRRIDELIEYPLALTGLRAAEPDATS